MNEKNTNIVIPHYPEGGVTRRDAMRTLLARGETNDARRKQRHACMQVLAHEHCGVAVLES